MDRSRPASSANSSPPSAIVGPPTSSAPSLACSQLSAFPGLSTSPAVSPPPCPSANSPTGEQTAFPRLRSPASRLLTSALARSISLGSCLITRSRANSGIGSPPPRLTRSSKKSPPSPPFTRTGSPPPPSEASPQTQDSKTQDEEFDLTTTHSRFQGL